MVFDTIYTQLEKQLEVKQITDIHDRILDAVNATRALLQKNKLSKNRRIILSFPRYVDPPLTAEGDGPTSIAGRQGTYLQYMVGAMLKMDVAIHHKLTSGSLDRRAILRLRLDDYYEFAPIPDYYVTDTVGDITIYLEVLPVERDAQLHEVHTKIEKSHKELGKLQARLNNPQFLTNAPKEVVACLIKDVTKLESMITTFIETTHPQAVERGIYTTIDHMELEYSKLGIKLDAICISIADVTKDSTELQTIIQNYYTTMELYLTMSNQLDELYDKRWSKVYE